MKASQRKQQEEQDYLLRKKQRTLCRKTDFFVYRYVKFEEDIRQLGTITDVELELFSFGLFKKQEKLKLFYDYLRAMLQYFADPYHALGSLKIALKGFDMGLKGKGLFQSLNEGLTDIHNKEGYQNHNLRQLWIHTSYLKNCTMKDFVSVFDLLFVLNDKKLQDLSMEFGFWKFQTRQPNYHQLDDQLQQRFMMNEIHECHLKHFRFDISGWYYEKYDALALLGFRLEKKQWEKLTHEMQGSLGHQQKLEGYENSRISDKVVSFHRLIEVFVQTLVSKMMDIKTFEIDMRNFDPVLNTKSLRGRLLNVKGLGRNEASFVSQSKKFYKNQEDKREEEKKEFKLTPMM